MSIPWHIQQAMDFQRTHSWEEIERLIRDCWIDERAHLEARAILRFERSLLALALRPEHV
jgi:hypothetical protein